MIKPVKQLLTATYRFPSMLWILSWHFLGCVVVFVKTATQNISIFALGWCGLYHKEEQRITKCDNLMFQNVAAKRSSTTNRGNNFSRITERRISGDSLGFECILHPNLIFGVCFFWGQPLRNSCISTQIRHVMVTKLPER